MPQLLPAEDEGFTNDDLANVIREDEHGYGNLRREVVF